MLLLINFCIQIVYVPLAAAADPDPVISEEATGDVETGSLPISVVISEIMWMGTDLSTADEWVEIAAFSDDPEMEGVALTLSGWTLRSVKDGVEHVMVAFPSGTSIASGSCGIVSNYPAAQSRLAGDPLLVTSGMGLANTKILLRLYDADGLLRDEADDGIGNPFAGQNTSSRKASMERTDLRSPGNDPANWKTAAKSEGFDEVAFELLGTPGSGCAPSASIPSSSASSPSSFSSASSFSEGASSVSSGTGVSLPAGRLRINELLADPTGSDDGEWIELVNAGSGSVNTAGMRLGMSGSTLYPLPAMVLESGQVLLVPRSASRISLVNAGGTVVLLDGSSPVDTLSYPSLPEGVSFGRDAEGIGMPFCIPTPGSPNERLEPQVAIDIQSGAPVGESVTLNLNLGIIAGAIGGATCAWDYPDGYVSTSCNPPSHAMNSFGEGNVTLRFTDYCGSTVEQVLPVFVTKKPKKIQEQDKNGILGFSCMPSSFTGALVTEIFPNPEGDEAEGEWIELRNESERGMQLCGWAIEDVSGKRYDLSRFHLPLGEAFVFGRKDTGITLNNDRDAVRLVAPDPMGGSGTVLQEVSFSTAPSEESYAMRGDGAWLWTPLHTPGKENAFPEVPLPVGMPKARLQAAMPNPKGEDAETEWVEIQNLTGRPLWMQGWTLRAGKDVSLNGIAIHPYATRRLLAKQLGITLRNSSGSVQLFDERGVEYQPLLWLQAKEDQQVMHPQRDNTSGYINVSDSKLCIDYYSALVENKNIELLMYSKEGGQIISGHGFDGAAFLLKNGCAYRSHLSNSGVLLGYDLYEQEAVRQKRGLWATQSSAARVLAWQSDERWRRILQEEGLVLSLREPEGLVSSGTTLSFATNLPATVFISLNDAPYVSFGASGSVVIRSDTAVQAYAELITGEGNTVRSDIVERAFVIRKSRYDRTELISEIYPSPRKGEKEWVELYNPTHETIPLAGWMIDDIADGGSKPQALPPTLTINPHSFLILRDLKIAWNNGGDDVRLIAPDGTVIDSVSYPSVKTGRAYGVVRDGEAIA